MNYNEIVDKLIGEVNPVGESNTDEQRFNNLQELCMLTSHLIQKIETVANNIDRPEFSIKKAAKHAQNFLKTNILIP